jgi:hypothetical protein
MTHRIRALFLVAIFLATPLASYATDVVESYPDGKPHFRYQVDAKKQKNGTFEELAPDGKVKVRGNYLANKMNGTWTVSNDAGTPVEQLTYRNDQLEGPYRRDFEPGKVQVRGAFHQDDWAGPISVYDEKGHLVRAVAYPRRLDAIQAAWKSLYPMTRSKVDFVDEPKPSAPYEVGRISMNCLQAGLKYTQLYRFLSGVPFEKMTLDPVMVDRAQHGAVILKRLGSLTHEPEQPKDMDDAFFKLAYAGCSQSNIFQGSASLFDAVDGFMDDSDEANVQAIGHRQWLLSPGLQKTGFGCCGPFVVQHVLSGGGARGFTFCAYPAPGYYPIKMIHKNAAWSVHFGRDKVKIGGADSIAIHVTPLDEHFASSDAKDAEVVSVINGGVARWNVIVFRPKIDSLEPGKYYVEIAGLRTPTGAAMPFSYMVDLREME